MTITLNFWPIQCFKITKRRIDPCPAHTARNKGSFTTMVLWPVNPFCPQLYFTRIIRKYRFKKKSVLKFPEFSIWKRLLPFLQKILSMLPWEWMRHFTTFLCTCIIKMSYNILKLLEVDRNHLWFVILKVSLIFQAKKIIYPIQITSEHRNGKIV